MGRGSIDIRLRSSGQRPALAEFFLRSYIHASMHTYIFGCLLVDNHYFTIEIFILPMRLIFLSLVLVLFI